MRVNIICPDNFSRRTAQINVPALQSSDKIYLARYFARAFGLRGARSASDAAADSDCAVSEGKKSTEGRKRREERLRFRAGNCGLGQMSAYQSRVFENVSYRRTRR